MKKIIALILVLTLSVFAFAACGKKDKDEDNTPTPEAPAEATYTLSLAVETTVDASNKSSTYVAALVLDENNTDTYETETIHYLGTYCTEPLEVALYHISGLKYIWDMFLMGLTIPLKSFIHLIS